ncbi:nucleotide sugar dehydrogenase [Bacillus lacus]|uniref:UDP-glucose 6-dehydrogenase n=1 Tax=Metabacillus lacus TaxID=1983721 RepID=A0A7X2LYP7_9BACI|nr:UDP-glucose/GDP-mannose dehydrogenase family protein [Metabacillus lacus]MRX72068.1 nucleotide sugar dehydrogenase [Metabacillus lacus]
MKISIIGTGYVGLVTGVCLSEVGHHVTCLDINPEKVDMLSKGISPIYEPGLGDLMVKNMEAGRLSFTTSHILGLKEADVVYIAVGTPQGSDGAANLSYVYQAARDIGRNITRDVVVVTKSTVPLGTNHKVKQLITANLEGNHCVQVVSNPEFLREGSAVYDAFYGDRIVIGADCPEAAAVIEEINKPFGIPVLKTSISSAEMIKYASNAFLATKISFINEIANLSEKVGADVAEVAKGMGQDARIGSQFLKAGIGYGGSCFPKDTSALVRISEELNHDFHLLRSVMEINENQKTVLVEKAVERLGSLEGKRIALLGLAFKPETDDMREAASIAVAEKLMELGAEIIAYDPVAAENAQRILPEGVLFAAQIEEAVKDADVVFILTDWKEIVEKALILSSLFMKNPIIFDGRNCYTEKEVKKYNVEYVSVGRMPVIPNREKEFEVTLAASF